MVVIVGKLEQIRALKKGGSIQDLLDSAYRIFGNPIAMFDTYYSLIAYTDAATDDPVWNELITTGTFSTQTQEFFANERFTFFVTNADKIVVLKSDELKYDRVLALVYNRNRVKVANLVMVDSNTPSSTDDIIAFNAFADKMISKIHDDEHFTIYGREYHDSLIGKILDGEIRDTRVYAAHIQILYDGFESYLYLAVIDVGQSGPHSERLKNIRDLLMEKYQSFKFAIYSGYIVMIMSSKQNSFYVDRVLGNHDDFFEINDIYAGISSSFENLYEMREYYNEAAAMLKRGLEDNGNQRVHIYLDC